MSVMEVDDAVADQVYREPTGLGAVDEQLLDQLIGQAKDRGVKLAGEGGLLQALTKRLLESPLEGEIADHLGYEARRRWGRVGQLAQRSARQDGADRHRPR